MYLKLSYQMNKSHTDPPYLCFAKGKKKDPKIISKKQILKEEKNEEITVDTSSGSMNSKLRLEGIND